MNQMDQVQIASGIIEASVRERLAGAETLEEKIRIAFKEAGEYWMSTDDDVRLKGGIGAVMLHLGIDDPDYKRICDELTQLRNLNAMMSGVPVDLELLSDMPEGYEPIGIIKLWKEIHP